MPLTRRPSPSRNAPSSDRPVNGSVVNVLTPPTPGLAPVVVVVVLAPATPVVRVVVIVVDVGDVCLTFPRAGVMTEDGVSCCVSP